MSSRSVVVGLDGAATGPDAVALGRRLAEMLDTGLEFVTVPGGVALVAARDLATRAGGSLLVLGVALPLSPVAVDDLGDRTPYLDSERAGVQSGLERALAEQEVGVPSRAEARIGDPAAELADASRDLDLLVCGSRGRGPLRAAVLGSVTQRLLASAACPVLVVPQFAALIAPAA